MSALRSELELESGYLDRWEPAFTLQKQKEDPEIGPIIQKLSAEDSVTASEIAALRREYIFDDKGPLLKRLKLNDELVTRL